MEEVTSNQGGEWRKDGWDDPEQGSTSGCHDPLHGRRNGEIVTGSKLEDTTDLSCFHFMFASSNVKYLGFRLIMYFVVMTFVHVNLLQGFLSVYAFEVSRTVLQHQPRSLRGNPPPTLGLRRIL